MWCSLRSGATEHEDAVNAARQLPVDVRLESREVEFLIGGERSDPNGIHTAIWGGFSDEPFVQPLGEPLTLVAYSAGERKKAYIEPTAVGSALIDMPLFLTPETYVNVPLEATYLAAYRGVPRKWKAVLEAPIGQ
jgi:hypothetical protein